MRQVLLGQGDNKKGLDTGYFIQYKEGGFGEALVVQIASQSERLAAAPLESVDIRRQTITDAVSESLREKILSGELAEGAQLRQDAIAAAYGVSRIPVREALRQLESEGLVTFFPHRGAVVAELSLGEIEELFENRALLECDLLARAMPKQTEADLAAAAAILDAYEAAFDKADVGKWGQLNWTFHAALYAPANRPRSMALVQNLHNNTDRYLRLQLLLTGGVARAEEEHRSLLALCRRGDSTAACDLLRRHILDAGTDLVAFLREHRAERKA